MTVLTYAQTITTDRPGITNGVSIVPLKTLQLESGLRLNDYDTVEEFFLPENIFRYGMGDRFELRAGINISLDYANERVSRLGLNNFMAGFKYALLNKADSKFRLSSLSEFYLPVGINKNTPDFQFAETFLAEYKISANWVLDINAGVVLQDESSGFGGLFVTYKSGQSWNAFAEWYIENVGIADQQIISAGWIKSLANDRQLDISMGIDTDGYRPFHYFALGYSLMF